MQALLRSDYCYSGCIRLCLVSQSVMSMLPPKGPRSLLAVDVAKHSTREDCWVIIHDQVYDVTNYLVKHPGGRNLILKHAGKDCTEDFEGMFHSPKARGILQELLIGTIKGSRKAPSANSLSPFGVVMNPRTGKTTLNTLGAPSSVGAPYRRDPPKRGLNPKFRAGPARSGMQLTVSSPEDSKSSGVVTQLELLHSTQETHDTKCLLLRPCLHLQPGQHIFIQAGHEPDGSPAKRPYTPIRTDDRNNTTEIIVKAYPGGIVSQRLHTLANGSRIKISRPLGELTVKPKSNAHMCFISAGTGVAPMIPLLQQCLPDAKHGFQPQGVTIICANKTLKDILLRNELQSLQAVLPNCRLHHALSNEESIPSNESRGTTETFSVGRLSSELMRELLPKPTADTAVFVCGSEAFNASIAGWLLDSGWNADSIHKFQ